MLKIRKYVCLELNSKEKLKLSRYNIMYRIGICTNTNLAGEKNITSVFSDFFNAQTVSLL